MSVVQLAAFLARLSSGCVFAGRHDLNLASHPRLQPTKLPLEELAKKAKSGTKAGVAFMPACLDCGRADGREFEIPLQQQPRPKSSCRCHRRG